MRLLNWELMANPANWIIIFLVLYLCTLLARMLYDAAIHGASPLPAN